MHDILSNFIRISQKLLEAESKKPTAEFIPSDSLFSSLDLSLTQEGVCDEDLLDDLEKLVLHTPRTATNEFFNQLFGGRNDKATLGDLLAVMLNNSMYTYKAAGAQIGVEKVILRSVCNLIGWGDNSDGTIAPGGSMTNFMSMVMARDAVDPDSSEQGARQKLTVYTSEESHYSIPKNSAFSGIGREQVRYIPTDERGRMRVDALESAIEKDIKEGFTPALVNSTAGTTVMGAFDPIRTIHPICKQHNIWLHVDGAYCGSVLFSERYRHLIQGIELVDSFSFNAHKMLGTPLSCSLIVIQNKEHLYNSFSNDANYLYQTDHDEFNLGKTSIQCGRRNDALKFWTLWKSVGSNGLGMMVDHQFEMADVARSYIRQNEDYTLYSYDESISICFNYRDIPARVLCTALYEHESLLVGYGTFDGREFIRLVTVNSILQKSDILNFFQKLEQFVDTHAETLIAEIPC